MAKKVVLTDVQIERAKNAYVVHQKPLQVIAQDLGLSIPTVSRYLKLAGVDIRRKGRPKLVVPVVEPTVADLPSTVSVEQEEPEEHESTSTFTSEVPVFDFN